MVDENEFRTGFFGMNKIIEKTIPSTICNMATHKKNVVFTKPITKCSLDDMAINEHY